jgi:hypothetical protein
VLDEARATPGDPNIHFITDDRATASNASISGARRSPHLKFAARGSYKLIGVDGEHHRFAVED